MENNIFIVGAGGHAKVVADAILKEGKYQLIGFLDDNLPIETLVFEQYRVLEKISNYLNLRDNAAYFVVAMGNNLLRSSYYEEIGKSFKTATIIHPSAQISSTVKIDKGTIVLAGAIVNSSAEIAENCIINSGVIVDHDCKIGANTHLSIGTKVGSNSHISENYTSSVGEVFLSFSKV